MRFDVGNGTAVLCPDMQPVDAVGNPPFDANGLPVYEPLRLSSGYMRFHYFFATRKRSRNLIAATNKTGMRNNISA